MQRKTNPTPLKIELYDLNADISESRDVAAEHPERVRELEAMLVEHLRRADRRKPRYTVDQQAADFNSFACHRVLLGAAFDGIDATAK